jgi:hypothetical protein
MADAKNPKEDEARAKLAQVSRDLWNIVPDIEDFDRLEYVLRPYVMRMPVANYQSRSLTTDSYGFRSLVTDTGVVDFDQFRDAPGPKGVLLGDSTIFGYGLGDDETLHAQLSRRNSGSAPWYSLASPVANIFQSRLLLELFLPANLAYATMFISAAAPVIYLLSPFDTKPYPVLFGQSTDAMFNAGAVATRTDPQFTLASGVKVNDPQTAFQNALDDVRKNIHLMAAHLRALTAARMLVCFKPIPLWIDKPLAPQERQVMDLFVQKHQTHIALVTDDELRPYWRQYIASIETACQECGCDFIDFNQMDALKAPDWLFFDHFHLNAQGTSHIADRISDWAHQTTSI